MVPKQMSCVLGVYAAGLVISLLVTQTGKMFIAQPRPYFISLCRPAEANCVSASMDICLENDTSVLVDAATSFPSLPTAASSFSSVYIAAYIHVMLGQNGAYVVQAMVTILLLMVTVLASFVELGVNRSHWTDIVAADIIGISISTYLVLLVVNGFQEKAKSHKKVTFDSVEVQVELDITSPSSPVFKYEKVQGPLQFPRRTRRRSEELALHRDATWDNSFQKDLVRSLGMYKKFNEQWASKAPVIGAEKFYEIVTEEKQPANSSRQTGKVEVAKKLGLSENSAENGQNIREGGQQLNTSADGTCVSKSINGSEHKNPFKSFSNASNLQSPKRGFCANIANKSALAPSRVHGDESLTGLGRTSSIRSKSAHSRAGSETLSSALPAISVHPESIDVVDLSAVGNRDREGSILMQQVASGSHSQEHLVSDEVDKTSLASVVETPRAPERADEGASQEEHVLGAAPIPPAPPLPPDGFFMSRKVSVPKINGV